MGRVVEFHSSNTEKPTVERKGLVARHLGKRKNDKSGSQVHFVRTENFAVRQQPS
jgi:hypothetical protein